MTTTEDLINRNLAIAYATSGFVRRIDGEDWIRTSEVKQSLNDVPTVNKCDNCDLMFVEQMKIRSTMGYSDITTRGNNNGNEKT